MADLDVVMAGRRVGTIERTSGREAQFEYDPAWSQTPLSVSMPLTQRSYSNARLAPYLWGLLPDNERVVERWARDFHVSASDVVGLLANVGEDVAGAAQYVPSGSLNEASSPAAFDRLAESDVAELLRVVERDSAAWHGRGPQGGRWSLAGAQGKLALAFDPELGWMLPRGAMPTTHIIKPAIAGYLGHDANEHLCLNAAALLGLRSASSDLRYFGDQRAVVVARYDRTSPPNVQRVHQEDMCQALSVLPGRKYQAEGGPSATDIARLIRQVSSNPGADIRRFCEALLFNWLIVGTDAHAKNYSFLLSDASVRLAPLYDLASILPHDVHPKKARLAMKIHNTYKPTELSASHWRAFAVEAGVDRDWIVARGLEMASAVSDAFRDAALDSQVQDATLLIDHVALWSKSCSAALTR
jgi:serine/threonine-protein kinase HipA